MIDQRLVDIFVELVQIDGLSGNEAAVAAHVKSFLDNLGIEAREDDAASVSGGNSGNVIATVGYGGNRAFLAHMDTARPTLGMMPQVLSDRITSDGSTILGADNRAGIASILYAVEKHIANSPTVPDVTLAFTVCEETSLAGSRFLSLPENVQMGFVFDSSYRPGKFIYGSYGAIGFKVQIVGRAAHSGLAPEKGVSAIQVAAKAISRLSLGRIDEQTTANIGLLSGGSAVNVIPAQVQLEGEIRSRKVERVEEILECIQTVFKEECSQMGAKLAFQHEWDFKPFTLSPEIPIYQAIESAIRAAGLTPNPVISAGGSDANSLNANGLPAVNIGIGAQNPHADDEFIMLEDLQYAANIASNLLSQTGD